MNHCVSTPSLIVIATSTFDEAAFEPVRKRLEDRGCSVVTYLTDKVLTEFQHFQLAIDVDGVLSVHYEDVDISPHNVGSAWLWKVTSFRNRDAATNLAKQLSLVNEMTQTQHAIWSLYPDEIWLNSPRSTYRANLKLEQLVIARRVGFIIPPTVVTNQWSDVEEMLMRDGGDAIVKMSRGVIADHNTVKGMYTTRLTRELVADLRERAVAFPGIYQSYVEKRREWRVTVVGDRVFSAAIYTRDDAKEDWRKMQIDPGAVQFRRDKFPHELELLCHAYLRHMGLRYGAFDFIERPSGEVVFLECNPSGQFMWLQDDLGYCIADGIADELISIAREH